MTVHQWRSHSICLALIAIALVMTHCANMPETRRLHLHADAAGNAGAALLKERIAHANAVLSGEHPDGVSPVLRWQAAENLGDLNALDAYELLISRGLGRVADRDAAVRRECVIALGKLGYDGPLDPRRKCLLAALENRLGRDRSGGDNGHLLERDERVRHAMFNTIITLGVPAGFDYEEDALDRPGYKDAAASAHTLATLFHSEREAVEGRTNTGLRERAFDALVLLTQTPQQDAIEERLKLPLIGSMSAFLTWWLDRVAALPSMEHHGA